MADEVLGENPTEPVDQSVISGLVSHVISHRRCTMQDPQHSNHFIRLRRAHVLLLCSLVVLLQGCKRSEVEWLGLIGTVLDQIRCLIILSLALLQKKFDPISSGK
jgi:hypothetical protein